MDPGHSLSQARAPAIRHLFLAGWPDGNTERLMINVVRQGLLVSSLSVLAFPSLDLAVKPFTLLTLFHLIFLYNPLS